MADRLRDHNRMGIWELRGREDLRGEKGTEWKMETERNRRPELSHEWN